jgi:uncharacterized protein (TIGR02246 family)
MRSLRFAVATVLALPLLAAAAAAQGAPAAPADAIHDEIRRVRDDVIAAIARGDVDGVLAHLHPNVVFTPMDAEVCHGPQEVRAYFVKMMQGPGAIVKSVQLDFQVDRLTDLYGDVGLAFGSSNDHYTLADGMSFPVQTRWTCALARHEGRWKIAAFQAAPSAFDNPILAKAKRTSMLAGGGVGLGGGLLVGALLAVVARRRRG